MPVINPSERVGKLVDGKYKFERVLAQGGMGVVFEARHVLTQRRVAVKLLKADFLAPELQARLSFEARAATTLNHPNVVQVLDMGWTEDAVSYLVMELLEGRTLKDELRARGPLPAADALAYLLPVMGALVVAHKAGIVHRDIKPANIFLSADSVGRVVPKLLDFGIAKAVEETGVTEPGAMMGTPAYLAPEQASGHGPATPAADIWSLGATMFECLAGHPPFGGANASLVIHQLLHESPPPLHTKAPHVPAAVCAAVDRALRRDPAARYPDVAAFARALLVTALDSQLVLPLAPEPIGLAEWPRWLADAKANAQVTMDPAAAPALAASRAQDVVTPALAAPPSATPPSAAARVALAVVTVIAMIAAAWFVMRSPSQEAVAPAVAPTHVAPELPASAPPPQVVAAPALPASVALQAPAVPEPVPEPIEPLRADPPRKTRRARAPLVPSEKPADKPAVAAPTRDVIQEW